MFTQLSWLENIVLRCIWLNLLHERGLRNDFDTFGGGGGDAATSCSFLSIFVRENIQRAFCLPVTRTYVKLLWLSQDEMKKQKENRRECLTWWRLQNWNKTIFSTTNFMELCNRLEIEMYSYACWRRQKNAPDCRGSLI